jgi:hypothetical protein
MPALLLDDSLKRSRIDSMVHGLSFKDSVPSSALASAPKLFQRIDAQSLQHRQVVRGADLLLLMQSRSQASSHLMNAAAAPAAGGDANLSFISVSGGGLDLSADGGACLGDSSLDITGGGAAAADISGISSGGGARQAKTRRLDASFKVESGV